MWRHCLAGTRGAQPPHRGRQGGPRGSGEGNEVQGEVRHCDFVQWTCGELPGFTLIADN